MKFLNDSASFLPEKLKNTLFLPKTLIFDPKSRKCSQNPETYPKIHEFRKEGSDFGGLKYVSNAHQAPGVSEADFLYIDARTHSCKMHTHIQIPAISVHVKNVFILTSRLGAWEL